jgi:hypothetical protein
MDYTIKVYRKFAGDRIRLVAEIPWTGEFTKNPTRFARRHGGDIIEVQPKLSYRFGDDDFGDQTF